MLFSNNQQTSKALDLDLDQEGSPLSESGIPDPTPSPRTASGLRPKAMPESERQISELVDAGWEELASEPPPALDLPVLTPPPLPAIDLYAGGEPQTRRFAELESADDAAQELEAAVEDVISEEDESGAHPADAEDRTVQKFVFPDIMDLDYDLDPTANVPSEWLDHLAASSARRSDRPPPPPMLTMSAGDDGAVTAMMPAVMLPQQVDDQEGNELPTMRPPSFVDLDRFGGLDNFTAALPPLPRPSPLGPFAGMIPTPNPPPPASSRPFAVFVPPPISSQRLPVAAPVPTNPLSMPTPTSLRRGQPIPWRPGPPEPVKRTPRPLRPLVRGLVLVAIAFELVIILAVLWRLLK